MLRKTRLIEELFILFVDIECDLRASLSAGAFVQGERGRTVACPKSSFCSADIRKRVDGDLLCDHVRGIESQSEVADDLVLFILSVVFADELFSP